MQSYADSIDTTVTTADAVAQKFPPIMEDQACSSNPDCPTMGMATASPKSATRDRTMVSAYQCKACHGGTDLFDFVQPSMTVNVPDGPTNVLQNYSPHGEWYGSMMGQAGRDPVFHAQLECEKVRHPYITEFLDDTCYTCHGGAGRAQIHLDEYGTTMMSGDEADQKFAFEHKMVFETYPDKNWLYGALARDGINCTLCHSVDVNPPDPPPPFVKAQALDEVTTGQLSFIMNNDLFGPFPNEGLKPKPMDNSLGKKVQFGSYLDGKSDVCNGCHTIHLPEVQKTYNMDGQHPNPMVDKNIAENFMDYEQSTAMEHQYSAYGPDGTDPKPCQQCHMMTTDQQGIDLNTKIANIMDKDDFERAEDRMAIDGDKTGDKQYEGVDLSKRLLRRHTLVGLNLPSMKMIQQYPDLLGVVKDDPDLFPQTYESSWFAVNQSKIQGTRDTADIEISDFAIDTKDKKVTAQVCTTNKAGHKFPTGVGFRCAFVEFTIRDQEDNILWQSGGTNNMGMIIDGAQRHNPEDASSLIAGEYTAYFHESQPHYQTITRQDQAQIYEDKILDQSPSDSGITIDGVASFPEDTRYTFSFLSLFNKMKDNRLLPKGFVLPGRVDIKESVADAVAGAGVGCPTEETAKQIAPVPAGSDPDYCNEQPSALRNNTSGRDCLTYEASLSEADIAKVQSVEATLYYQSLVPSFLVDKFTCMPKSGEDPRPVTAQDTKMTQNFFYFTSHLFIKGSAYESWKMELDRYKVTTLER